MAAGRELKLPILTGGETVLWESTDGGVHEEIYMVDLTQTVSGPLDVEGIENRYGRKNRKLRGGYMKSFGVEQKGGLAEIILVAKGIDPSEQNKRDFCVKVGHIPNSADYLEWVGVVDPGSIPLPGFDHPSVHPVTPPTPPPTPLPPVTPPETPPAPQPPPNPLPADLDAKLNALAERIISKLDSLKGGTADNDKAKLALQHLSLKAAEIQALGTPKHQRFDDLVAAISAAVAEGGA